MNEMTEAMREWWDENMEAIREGVKAVKEGRITPAETFFEWMRAKYVRDMREERIARLQERVEEAEAHDCGYALTRVLEIAERQLALAERRKKALKKYGKHGLGCTLGLLPAWIHRQSFSDKENERLKRASIKECTCGFRASIEEEDR